MTYGQYAGAAAILGMTAYGIYQNAQSGQMQQSESIFSGMTSGAFTGAAMGGPWGAVLGGFAGAAIGSLTSESELLVPDKIPTLDFLYEVIDDKIRIIGETWKNTDIVNKYDLISAIEDNLQAQINFFKYATSLVDKSTISLAGIYTASGSVDILTQGGIDIFALHATSLPSAWEILQIVGFEIPNGSECLLRVRWWRN